MGVQDSSYGWEGVASMHREPRLDKWLGGWRTWLRQAGVQSPGHRAREGWRRALGAGSKKVEEPERERAQRRAPRACTGPGKGQFPLGWEERAGHQCDLLQHAENGFCTKLSGKEGR